MSPPRPRISSPSPSFTQITYQLSHAHTYICKFYPRPLASRPTPLSEILVIGHESGIKILWREPPVKVEEDEDEAMVIDGQQQQEEGAEVQGELEEGAFACEYTIHLGTSVHCIAFPPASILPTEGPTQEADELDVIADKLLHESILIAAACGDRTIRLITLPLTPPPSSSAGKREHIIVLGGGVSGHREPAECVSVSVLPTPSDRINFSHPESDDISYDSQISDDAGGMDVVIASSSVDTNGVLLLWRISILSPPRGSVVPASFGPTSRPTILFLQSPITSLSFSTSAQSLSRQHQLLVSDRKGAIRILDTKTKTWLCSFYTPYSQITERRKKVLGAEWCTGGRSVVVLCEGGEWGIWDLESVLSGIQETGTVVTGFIVGGMVGETWYSNSSKRPSHSNHDENASEVSGRSPSARGSSIISAATSTTSRRRRSGSLRAEDRIGLKGLLSVAPIAASSFFSNQATLVKGKSTTTMGSLQIYDEVITMVFGSVILVLPSLKKFWKTEEVKIKKRAAQNVNTGSSNFNSIAWSGEDGKVEKEFLVLEGWDTRGAAVGDLDVVTGDAEHDRVARILLTTSCRLELLDVGESKADEPPISTAKPVEAGAKLAKRINPTRKSAVGGKGKRKVVFLQDSPA